MVKVLLILSLVEISLEADDGRHNASHKEREMTAKGDKKFNKTFSKFSWLNDQTDNSSALEEFLSTAIEVIISLFKNLDHWIKSIPPQISLPQKYAAEHFCSLWKKSKPDPL